MERRRCGAVTSALTNTPELGDGVYSFPEAAAILRHVDRGLSVRQLRHWMATGLADASYETDRGDAVLSFDDLVSLEIVGRFRSVGTSLQKVRVLGQRLQEAYPTLERPFAYKVFFTDGASIWVQEFGEEGPVATEVVGPRRRHRVWLDAIQTFATEIRFDDGTPPHAAGWTLSPWVEINPAVQFGAPVVRGSRVPVRTVVANLAAGSPAEVADWYGLSEQAVLGAKDYAAAH